MNEFPEAPPPQKRKLGSLNESTAQTSLDQYFSLFSNSPDEVTDERRNFANSERKYPPHSDPQRCVVRQLYPRNGRISSQTKDYYYFQMFKGLQKALVRPSLYESEYGVPMILIEDDTIPSSLVTSMVWNVAGTRLLSSHSTGELTLFTTCRDQSLQLVQGLKTKEKSVAKVLWNPSHSNQVVSCFRSSGDLHVYDLTRFTYTDVEGNSAISPSDVVVAASQYTCSSQTAWSSDITFVDNLPDCIVGGNCQGDIVLWDFRLKSQQSSKYSCGSVGVTAVCCGLGGGGSGYEITYGTSQGWISVWDSRMPSSGSACSSAKPLNSSCNRILNGFSQKSCNAFRPNIPSSSTCSGTGDFPKLYLRQVILSYANTAQLSPIWELELVGNPCVACEGKGVLQLTYVTSNRLCDRTVPCGQCQQTGLVPGTDSSYAIQSICADPTVSGGITVHTKTGVTMSLSSGFKSIPGIGKGISSQGNGAKDLTSLLYKLAYCNPAYRTSYVRRIGVSDSAGSPQLLAIPFNDRLVRVYDWRKSAGASSTACPPSVVDLYTTSGEDSSSTNSFAVPTCVTFHPQLPAVAVGLSTNSSCAPDHRSVQLFTYQPTSHHSSGNGWL